MYQQQQRQEWERTRWSTTILLNIHLEKKNKIQPKDLARFPWEKELKGPKLTKEQAKEILAKWERKQ